MTRWARSASRLTEHERSIIVALVTMLPPGKPPAKVTGELTAPDPETEAEWGRDTLTNAT